MLSLPRVGTGVIYIAMNSRVAVLLSVLRSQECSVNKLHVVVPEAGLLFNAPAPKVEPMPSTQNKDCAHQGGMQQEGSIAACTEKLLNMKAV